MASIDCFLIGHNEGDFESYEKKMRYFGRSSESYRDLSMSIAWHGGKPYTVPGLVRDMKGATAAQSLRLYNGFSLTIACIGSYLYKHGVTFDYAINYQSEKEQIARALKGDHVPVMAITTTLYTTALPIIEIVQFIRSVCKETPIVVGGPYIMKQCSTQSKEHIGRMFDIIGADYWINSPQGEDTLASLVHSIRMGININTVSNLIYKNDSGLTMTVVQDDSQALMMNPINWSLFSSRMGNEVSLRTSRSCPFSCSYCSFPLHQGQHELCSVDDIKNAGFAELEQIGINHINIVDDSFNVPLPRFKEILKMKVQSGFNFKWNAYIRCQYLDAEAVALMLESGCEGVFLGIESANQEVLDNMNKRVRVEDYVKGLELLKDANILTFTSFIFGFPGETISSIQDSVNFIRQCGPDFYRIQLWFCDPITPIYRDASRYGLTGKHFEWSHKTMSSREAQDCVERAFLEIKESTWLPQYDFDFVGVCRLLDKGMEKEDIKKFLEVFNQGVAQNIWIKDSKLDEMGRIDYENCRRYLP